MKALDKTKSPDVTKALIQRRHRSLTLKLDDFMAFYSMANTILNGIFLVRTKTAINRAFKREIPLKINDCSTSQNTKVKKLNT